MQTQIDFITAIVLSLMTLFLQSGHEPPLITPENIHQLEPLVKIEDAWVTNFSRFSDTVQIFSTTQNNDETFSINTWDMVSRGIVDSLQFDGEPVVVSHQLPDSSTLIVTGIVSFYIVDYDAYAIREKVISTSQYYLQVAVSTDGQTLVYTECEFLGAYQGGCEPSSWYVRVIDLQTLALRNIIEMPDEERNIPYRYAFEVRQLALSANGNYLLGQSDMGDLLIWDTDSGEQILRRDGVVCSEYSRFGSGMRFVDETTVLIPDVDCHEPVVRLWNFDTNDESLFVPPTTSQIYYMNLSPDGQILGVIVDDDSNRNRLIYFYHLQTGGILTQIQIDTNRYRFEFSPDGRYIIVGDTIWSIPQ